VESDEETYHCSLTSSQHGDCSGSVTVVFNNPVMFLTLSGLTYHAFLNTSVTLECDVMYHEELRWQRGNLAIISDDRVYVDGTNLHFSQVSLEDAGTYSCFVENENSLQSITAHLRVYCTSVMTRSLAALTPHWQHCIGSRTVSIPLNTQNKGSRCY